MSAVIGNRGLLRSLGKALGIESVKQAPMNFNTAEMVAALQVHSGFANYEKWASPNVPPVSIAGLTSFNLSMVAQKPAYTFIPDFTVNSQGREMVILGYYLVINYTAGGAAADANVPLSLTTGWFEPDGTLSSLAGNLETWAIVVATRLYYTFGFPFWGKQHSSYYTSMNHANNRIWVPAGSEYHIQVGHGGAGWPAGTTMQLQSYGVSVPKGICPPLCG